MAFSSSRRLAAFSQSKVPPQQRQRLSDRIGSRFDLGKIKELIGIEPTGDGIMIKAATTHYDVASSETVKKAIPALAFLASLIGDPAVRHRGTIGGSIANNDPAADYPSAVLALAGTVHTDRRQIAAAERAGIRLIVTLSNSWSDYGGVPRYLRWVGRWRDALDLQDEAGHEHGCIHTLVSAK